MPWTPLAVTSRAISDADKFSRQSGAPFATCSKTCRRSHPAISRASTSSTPAAGRPRSTSPRCSIQPALKVLDSGGGLGGSARYLVSEHGGQVTGIDVTKAYVEAASALAELVGMTHLVAFHRASALDRPFPDGSFAGVWTARAAEPRRQTRLLWTAGPGPHTSRPPAVPRCLPGAWGCSALSRTVGRGRLDRRSRPPRAGTQHPCGLGFSVLDWGANARCHGSGSAPASRR